MVRAQFFHQGQAMVPGDVTHEGLVVQGAFLDKLNFQGGGRYARIQMPIQNIFDQAVGGLLLDDQVHLGVFLDKGAKEHGKQGGHHRGDDPQGKVPADISFVLVHDILDPIRFRHNVLGLGHDLFAYLGNGNGLLSAVKDQDSQLLLQFLDLHAQGRLGDKTFFGGQGAVFVFRHGQYVLKLGNGHINIEFDDKNNKNHQYNLWLWRISHIGDSENPHLWYAAHGSLGVVPA